MTLDRFAFLASPLLAFLTLLPSQIIGQTPVLLKDINQVAGKNPSSDPKEFASLGALTFFAATTAQKGRELWVSDGSAKGTRLFADLVPGLSGSDPVQLTVVGSRICFLAWDPIHGRELWQTDGTPTGTVLVRDIRPGIADAEISNLVAVGSRLYFVADDGTHGAELWKSDGSGAALVTDLYKGSAGSKPIALTAVGSEIFFMAIEPTVGRELFRSDGTIKGTVLIADLSPGQASSTMSSLIGVGRALYFVWGQVSGGHIIWKSDGTAKGTKPLAKKDWGFVMEVAAVGNKLLLTTLWPPSWNVRRLYATDGRTTSLLQTGRGTVLQRGFSTAKTMYFAATSKAGAGLWKTDGTAKNTILVKLMSLHQMQPFGNRFAALAVRPTNPAGFDLWVSDGTNQGTTLMTSFPKNFKLEMHGSASNLCIAMDDPKLGRELWVRDTTPTNPGALIDLDAVRQTGGSGPLLFDRIGKWLLFSADDGVRGRELWRTDGTSAGTSLVKDIRPGKLGGVGWAFKLGSQLLLGANDGKAGYELWRSDGTPTGTVRVKDIRPGPQGSAPSNMTRVGNVVYFLADDGVHGIELWRSDGTSAGTRLVIDFSKGARKSFIFNLTAFRGELYFSAYTPLARNYALWRSDGTARGTKRVSNLSLPDPLNSDDKDRFAVYRGHLYFQAYDLKRSNGRSNGLWRTDGTPQGTTLVKGNGPYRHEYLMVAGDSLYFRATDQQHGPELWRSDGTALGTHLVRDLLPGPTGPSPKPMTAFGDELIFSARTGGSKNPQRTVLWRTRGAASNTSSLPLDLWAAKPLQVVGSRRLWSIGGNATGPGLWSMGKITGGIRVDRYQRYIHPGPYYGGMSAIKIYKGKLLFSSWDAIRGAELWLLDPGAISEPVGQACSPTHLLPEMSVTDPVLGGSMEFKGIKTPTQAAALLLLGAQASQPVPLTPTCSLYIDLRIFAIYSAFLTKGDSWKVPLFLPNQTSLMGIQVLAQTVFFRPGSGFSTTQGKLLTLGH